MKHVTISVLVRQEASVKSTVLVINSYANYHGMVVTVKGLVILHYVLALLITENATMIYVKVLYYKYNDYRL